MKKKKASFFKKRTASQWYFFILKYVSITWLTIGLVLALTYMNKDSKFVNPKISQFLFSEFK